MTIQNYAIVNGAGQVTNIIISDGSFPPPEGSTMVVIGDSGAQIGWNYAGGTFTNPNPPIPPTTAQVALMDANAAIAAGLQIISTSTPSLNGTYSVDAAAIANINAVATYILRNSTFPNSASQMPWMDSSGNPHVFPSTAEFDDFATAVGNFVTAVVLYGDSGGQIGSIPSQPVTIP